MRLLESPLKTLLILLSILIFTTAIPFPSPPTTETETEIELHPPNAVHLAISFISLSHALSSLRLTKCPLDVVSINQTTSERSTGISKRGHEEAAATPHLSPPSAHLSLKFIALGRGTQNYTCPTTSKDNTSRNASATPIATGAVATLYDISCLAATPKSHALRFLHALPGFTRSIPQEVLAFYAVMLSQSAIIGEHYFSSSQSSSSTTSTTAAAAMPVFDLRPATFGKQGGRYESNWVKAKKVESVNAPGSGGDDVPWLKMVGVEGSGIKEIYRVHTAGGMSPATCAAHEGEFGV
ncbi:hypothetical protein ASPACDRAFT_1859222 [Aspergillus aculeatus ATCC 16872]|uniref:Uncharacterized protein n=1 Tax=Aspergillus aculeatus (strain ATCC 16872 / CBS 172.66 / WB 5094) TaxID=690307 RepID=A0A1L9WK83_ASPA1|nr:uncharacterized protein ASPACDRAFT_1859222 [Aspergillus aculeatus ATCC 16872]OJJ96544.1 hypothetical protein ASPACDRAFT_1859222 [Aspergillus aculeatus ATCC 16872]